MNSLTNLEVQIVASGGESGEGSVRVVCLSTMEPTKRALKTAALLWLGALLAVPLPIIHFVVVPALVAAGPAAGAWIYLQKGMVYGDELRCPACGRKGVFERRPDRWPILEACRGCRTSLRVEATRSAD